MPLKIVERTPRWPPPPGAPLIRRLSVSTEVADLLDGVTSVNVFPDFEAERMIGIYCRGGYLSISRKKNDVRPDLEMLEGFEEVWSLCLRKPKPGWRLLGRFLQKDHLVLLRGWDKHKLFSQYEKAAEQIIEDWSALFDTTVAHSGDWYSGYLSGAIRDADEPL